MTIFVPFGDPSLTICASEVRFEEILSEEIQLLIDRMLEIVKENQVDMGNGIMSGLAAPQIGVSKRIIVVDIEVEDSRNNFGNLMPYINPEIVWYSEEIVWGSEGCYSVDEHLDGKIPRSESVRVAAYDREGNFIDQIFKGFTARIFQHEVDHLNGIRFPDRVTENGILHWIPDNQYNLYLKQWENWPLIVPWQLWLDMKEGKTYDAPAF